MAMAAQTNAHEFTAQPSLNFNRKLQRYLHCATEMATYRNTGYYSQVFADPT